MSKRINTLKKQLIHRIFVVIPLSRNYQRLTTYGFDPLGKPLDGYALDTTYDLRIKAYDLQRVTDLPKTL